MPRFGTANSPHLNSASNETTSFSLLYIEIFHKLCVFRYKVPTGLNHIAHKHREYLVAGDSVLYRHAIDTYLYANDNGTLPNYIGETGQCQETGRDQAHAQLGLGAMCEICEMAWGQGDDLYGALDNRLMKGLGVDITYNHADYRLMSNRALEALSQFDEVNLFLRGIVPQIGYKWTTVTYERAERFAGESKYPLK